VKLKERTKEKKSTFPPFIEKISIITQDDVLFDLSKAYESDRRELIDIKNKSLFQLIKWYFKK
jgi:hypothetical protein